MSGTGKKALASEAAHKTAREVLKGIDSHAAPLTLPRAQEDFLRGLIRSKNLQLEKNGRIATHNVQTIKASVTAICRNREDKSLVTKDIWSRGSSMFSEEYLTTIGFRQSSASAAADEHATLSPTNSMPFADEPSPGLASTPKRLKLKLKAPISQRPQAISAGEGGGQKRSATDAALDGMEATSEPSTARKRQKHLEQQPRASGFANSPPLSGVQHQAGGQSGAVSAQTRTPQRQDGVEDQDLPARNAGQKDSKKRSAANAALESLDSVSKTTATRKRQKRSEQSGKLVIANSSQMSEEEFEEDRQTVPAATHAPEWSPITAPQEVQGEVPPIKRLGETRQESNPDSRTTKVPGSREKERSRVPESTEAAPILDVPAREGTVNQGRGQNHEARKIESDLSKARPVAEEASRGIKDMIEASLNRGETKSLELIKVILAILARGDVKLEDVIRESPRRVPMEDIGKGRVIAPKTDAQAAHAKHLAETLDSRSLEQIFPPELPGSARHNFSADSLYEAVLESARKAISQIASKAANFGINFARPNGLEYEVEPHFVETPEPRLEALYNQVLGSRDWKRAMLERQNQKDPWSFTAADLLTSLIAAAVYNNVFQVKQPWDISDAKTSAVGDRFQFGEQAMLDKGYQFSGFLQQWQFKMMNDKGFQSTEVQQHARSLATDLALTLSPHLALLRRIQKPEEERSGGGPGNTTGWVDYLERVFHEALVLKGKIGTYDDHIFEYFWPKPGSLMDGEDSMPLHENKAYAQAIVLVMWPGIRGERISGMKKDSFHLAEASVLTHKLREQDIPRFGSARDEGA